MRRCWVVPLVLVVAACTGPNDATTPSESSGATVSRGPTVSADPTAPAPTPTTTPPDPAGTAGMVGTATPAAPVGGRIAVTTAAGSLAVVDPQTDTLTTLDASGSPAAPVQPVGADDGLVWTDAVAPGGGSATAVHDGTRVRRIDHPVAPFLYLPAPEGRPIAALGNDPAGRGVALVMIESPDTDDVVATTVGLGQPFFLSWSPDGRLAAHVGNELAVIAVDGSRQSIPAVPGSFQAPAWTADGNLVVVLDPPTGTTVAAAPRAQASGGDLAVITDRGDLVTTIAPVTGPVGFVVRGDRVAWVQGEADAVVGPLRVADLATGAIEDVSAGPVVTADWSPDATMLLFHELRASGRIVPRVWDGTAVVDFPAHAPTSRWATEYLPFWFQYAQGVTQWAPDATAFVQAATTSEGDAVWIQPLVGDRRGVAEGDMAVWLPD